MNKNDCLKTAKLFLKLAKCDLTLIGIVKTAKIIVTAMLVIKSLAFLVLMLCGSKAKA